MTNNVRKIGLVSPDEQAKIEVLELLNDAIERVMNGEPVTDCLIIIIINHPGDTWTELASPTIAYKEWVGMIEQIKFTRMMQHYRKDYDEGKV